MYAFQDIDDVYLINQVTVHRLFIFKNLDECLRFRFVFGCMRPTFSRLRLSASVCVIASWLNAFTHKRILFDVMPHNFIMQ